MSIPEDRQHLANEEACEEVAKTVRLAVGALDHPSVDDKELEKLCDETLSERNANRKKVDQSEGRR